VHRRGPGPARNESVTDLGRRRCRSCRPSTAAWQAPERRYREVEVRRRSSVTRSVTRFGCVQRKSAGALLTWCRLQWWIRPRKPQAAHGSLWLAAGVDCSDAGKDPDWPHWAVTLNERLTVRLSSPGAPQHPFIHLLLEPCHGICRNSPMLGEHTLPLQPPNGRSGKAGSFTDGCHLRAHEVASAVQDVP
jgi:hypothetical protein